MSSEPDRIRAYRLKIRNERRRRTMVDVLRLRPETGTGGGSGEVRVWLAYTDGYSGVRRGSFHRYRQRDVEPFLFDDGSLARGRPAEPGRS